MAEVNEPSRRTWAGWSLPDRARHFDAIRRSVAAHGDELADLLAQARICSRAEAVASELIPLADAAAFLARRLPGLLSPRRLGRRGRPGWLFGVETVIHRDPYGTVLVIGPSNFPLFLPGTQVLQALAAGNAVLWKPAPGAGPVTHCFVRLLMGAGIPEGLLGVLDESAEASRAAVAQAAVDKVVLTGSAKTGRAVLGALAERLIPAAVELSGNDPVFVLTDSDPELVAGAIAYGLRLNGGRTCIAPRRIFVRERDWPLLRGPISEHLARIPPAALSPAQAALCDAVLADAAARGADIWRGAQGPGYSAALAVPIQPDARLAREDVFGPLAGVMPVASLDDAITQAGRCPYRLGASVFGPPRKAEAFAGRIDAGVICINDLIVPTADPRLPFEGRGESGYGATRGAEGLLAMTRPRVVVARSGRFRPHLAAPHPSDAALLSGYLRMAHGAGLTARWSGLWQMLRAMVAHGWQAGRQTGT